MVRQSVPINIPNTLSIVRILLTPLFAICLIKRLTDSALLVFAVAAVTDGLDGLVARLFNPVVSVVSGGVGTLLVVVLWALRFPSLRRLGALSSERAEAGQGAK